MNWYEELNFPVMVCDKDGVVVYMNQKSEEQYKKYGGKALIGKNLLDCHPEPSKSKLLQLLQEQKSNTYSIEKEGIKKLIHQTPWYKDGEYMGLVEISIEMPTGMPHFIRK
jgi:transcriptional regulator with PAS, ATPase and Fis domain